MNKLAETMGAVLKDEDVKFDMERSRLGNRWELLIFIWSEFKLNAAEKSAIKRLAFNHKGRLEEFIEEEVSVSPEQPATETGGAGVQ